MKKGREEEFNAHASPLCRRLFAALPPGSGPSAHLPQPMLRDAHSLFALLVPKDAPEVEPLQLDHSPRLLLILGAPLTAGGLVQQLRHGPSRKLRGHIPREAEYC
jgi:hypothetical protein